MTTTLQLAEMTLANSDLVGTDLYRAAKEIVTEHETRAKEQAEYEAKERERRERSSLSYPFLASKGWYVVCDTADAITFRYGHDVSSDLTVDKEAFGSVSFSTCDDIAANETSIVLAIIDAAGVNTTAERLREDNAFLRADIAVLQESIEGLRKSLDELRKS